MNRRLASQLARLEFDDPRGCAHVGYLYLLRAIGVPPAYL